MQDGVKHGGTALCAVGATRLCACAVADSDQPGSGGRFL